jgi:hypothetical protein
MLLLFSRDAVASFGINITCAERDEIKQGLQENVGRMFHCTACVTVKQTIVFSAATTTALFLCDLP